MLRSIATAAFCLAVWPTAAWAGTDCSLHCDFNHYYGPSDFTYIRPGLYGWPRCDAHGNCSPRMLYTYQGPYQGPHIEVRPYSRSTTRRRAIRY